GKGVGSGISPLLRCQATQSRGGAPRAHRIHPVGIAGGDNSLSHSLWRPRLPLATGTDAAREFRTCGRHHSVIFVATHHAPPQTAIPSVAALRGRHVGGLHSFLMSRILLSAYACEPGKGSE